MTSAETVGRPAALPFAQVPHWVLLAPITPEAKLIFMLLVAHVLRTDPANREAWPRRERLAAMARFKQPRSVDRYVTELEKLGAIVVDRGRHPTQPLRKRNTYTVRLPEDGAPLDYFGPLSVWEIQDEDDEETADQPGGALQRTSVTPEDADPAAPVTEVHSSAPREVQRSALREVRPGALEVEVVDKERVDEEVVPPVMLDASVPAVGGELPQDPIEMLSASRPREPPRRPLRGASPCGNSFCRGGVLHIGINQRPCHICPQPEGIDRG